DTSTCPAPPAPPNPPDPNSCSMSQGTVDFAFQVTGFQGVAVNPINRRLVFASPNATSSQIAFLDPLTRIFNSMSIFHGSVGTTIGSPEIGETAVGFQPFSNTVVLFNPTLFNPVLGQKDEISVIDPSLLQRPAFVKTDQVG